MGRQFEVQFGRQELERKRDRKELKDKKMNHSFIHSLKKWSQIELLLHFAQPLHVHMNMCTWRLLVCVQQRLIKEWILNSSLENR